MKGTVVIDESPAKRVGVVCLTWVMREIWGESPAKSGEA
jgi:hypothetical protein